LCNDRVACVNKGRWCNGGNDGGFWVTMGSMGSVVMLQFSLLPEVYWRYRSLRVGTVVDGLSGGQDGSEEGRSGEKVGVDRNIFPHYGIPLQIISDRDPCFDSKFTTELCRLLGIRQNISTTYHPQTDGQSERTNQSLETYLRLYCDTQQHEWAKLLPMAQYVWNSWPSSTTKQVPFNTLISYTPQAHQPTHSMANPDLQQCLDNINLSRTAVLEALRKV
jgi:hypothetical protein